MSAPKPPNDTFSAWDDIKYGVGFVLSVGLWIGGLGYAVISLLM
ncbi:hypothetical protein AWB69_00020 [Caballeronia udeis]|uniref:Uncharacterized protein n=1 Tax=Caballeronia udeis TaxID=1232866 RepID=A0A158EP07_9BURK|nr:hypothetical protein AWB69_00020 [Caballeronia udeis]